VRVVRHPTAASFLEAAEAWLLRAEVEHNVVLGLAHALATPASGPQDAPYLATVVDGDTIVACAFRMPPHKLLLARAETDAAAALARDALEVATDLPAVLGPEPAAETFGRAWSALAGVPVHAGKRQRIHVIHALQALDRPAPGRLRRVGEAELGRLVRWVAAFQRDVDSTEQEDPLAIAERYHAYGGLFVWDDGGPVSMVAFGGKTPNGVRVNLVYTPPERRRHGYATAAVWTLTHRLLDRGNRYCCLYTDLANPTSNAIYRRIGYRPVCDVQDWVFGVSAVSARDR
jgi:hypothetical protein